MNKEEAKKQLEILQQEVVKLRNIIDAPVDVIETVKNYNSILEISGTKKSDDEVKIKGFSDAENNVIKNVIRKMRICKVYNGNRLPKRGEKRWYSYYNVSSGFVFGDTVYVDAYAFTGSASRLSFLDEKSLKDFNKKFMYIDEAIIDMQD